MQFQKACQQTLDDRSNTCTMVWGAAVAFSLEIQLFGSQQLQFCEGLDSTHHDSFQRAVERRVKKPRFDTSRQLSQRALDRPVEKGLIRHLETALRALSRSLSRRPRTDTSRQLSDGWREAHQFEWPRFDPPDSSQMAVGRPVSLDANHCIQGPF